MSEALTPKVWRTARGPVEAACHGTSTGRPAVLVVHGMPGDYRQGQTVAEDLGTTTQVVLVSRPGYGRTPLRSGRSPQQQADLYAALLDELGIARAVAVGISGGGPSSYAFAETHHDRCAGLVLACAVAGHVLRPPAGMRRLAAVPGAWPALAGVARTVARARSPREPDPTTLTAVEQELLADPTVAAALRRFLAQSPSSLRGTGLRNDVLMLQRAVAAGPRPWPSGAAVPAVILHGDADAVVGVENAQAHAAAIPGARLEVLPGLGHAVPLFARARLTAVLHELLDAGRRPHGQD
jgi:pimeloyl-ACP methyl ester carboxylesterase